jgi:hypothetical protein
VIIEKKRKMNKRILKINSVNVTIKVKVEKQKELDRISMITQIKEKCLRKK